jgi:hypothetical protein
MDRPYAMRDPAPQAVQPALAVSASYLYPSHSAGSTGSQAACAGMPAGSANPGHEFAG